MFFIIITLLIASILYKLIIFTTITDQVVVWQLLKYVYHNIILLGVDTVPTHPSLGHNHWPLNWVGMKIIFCFLIIWSSHSSLLKEDSNASFESGILKLVNSPTNDDPRSPDSLEGSLEYKPFQSPNVKALLLPSHPHPPSHHDNEATPPVRSLPRNFHRQPPSLPPVRQMSEGKRIHVKKGKRKRERGEGKR